MILLRFSCYSEQRPERLLPQIHLGQVVARAVAVDLMRDGGAGRQEEVRQRDLDCVKESMCCTITPLLAGDWIRLLVVRRVVLGSADEGNPKRSA